MSAGNLSITDPLAVLFLESLLMYVADCQGQRWNKNILYTSISRACTVWKRLPSVFLFSPTEITLTSC